MKRDTQAGFTMIEVMISVLITAIAALGFIAMYMTETQAGAFTRHSTEASILATDKLEELRTVGDTPTSGNDTRDAQGLTGGMFTRQWTITTDTTNGFTSVIVQVGWNEDETVATCTVDSNPLNDSTACSRSAFCLPTGTCAGRAVIVRGRRN
jgi:prepilin-type N-terminal cleavage/methylation domain-containing protein